MAAGRPVRALGRCPLRALSRGCGPEQADRALGLVPGGRSGSRRIARRSSRRAGHRAAGYGPGTRRLGLTSRYPGGVPGLADYLEISVGQARDQFRVLRARRPVAAGRQVAFVPVETLLCLAAMYVVNVHRFKGKTADRAPEPVPSLARLFSRPASSVLSKMFNLDGSRVVPVKMTGLLRHCPAPAAGGAAWSTLDTRGAYSDNETA